MENGAITRRDMLALGAGGLLLPASSAFAAGPAPRRGGRIRVAGLSISTADTLDPAKGGLSTDYPRHYMLYNGLTELDRALRPRPSLAESIVSHDQRIWHVRMRKGISFHNGKTLTARDAVWSLLRHKSAVSKAEDFMGENHFMRLLSDNNPAPDAETKRLVLCTGKVSYELMEARDAAGDKNTQIVRVEQLYPFPTEALAIRLARMKNLEEVIWCQEEPRNQGSWFFVEPYVEQALDAAGKAPMRARYAGRKASASPATGLAKRHVAEQGALIADALGHSVREEIKRQKKG